MELKGKALFNLLKISMQEEKPLEIQSWQVEDLKKLTIEELFSRLKKMSLMLDESSFYLYAENCETPEELVECLCCDEESAERYDRVYLIIFELWRRLLKEKFCLSVFCDELDHWIELYDSEQLRDEEPLQERLRLLEDILDEAFNDQIDPKQILKEVACYCAHDLEQFLIDYIADQILAGNETYASELIDAFTDYVTDSRRFTLLRASLIALSDLETANRLYERVLEELYETPDLEVALQVAEHLIHHGHLQLFVKVAKFALSLIQIEEEFQVLLVMIAEYYRCRDKEVQEQQIQALLDDREGLDLASAVKKTDPAFLVVSNILDVTGS